MNSQFRVAFPNLSDVAKKKTSDPDPTYNCIAWAFKDNRRHWWPNNKRSYWPIDVSGMTTTEAFEAWFAADGWEGTPNCNVETGYEKIMLYALNGEPTHACRLLSSGVWTSKLGASIDLSHGFTDLDGPSYGRPFKVYKKPSA